MGENKGFAGWEILMFIGLLLNEDIFNFIGRSSKDVPF
jgi:hypothetical protein